MHGLKVEHARKTAHHERYHSTKQTETYGDNSFQMRLTARAIFRFRTIVRAVTFLFSFFFSRVLYVRTLPAYSTAYHIQQVIMLAFFNRALEKAIHDGLRTLLCVR